MQKINIEREIEKQKFILATEETFHRIIDQDEMFEIENCEINESDSNANSIELDRSIAQVFGIKPKGGESWFDGYFVRYLNCVWHRDTVEEVGQLLAALKVKYKTTDIQPA